MFKKNENKQKKMSAMGPIGRNEKSEAASELNQLLVAVVGVACR